MWFLESQNRYFREEGTAEQLNKSRAENGWLQLTSWNSSVILARQISVRRKVAYMA